MRLQDTQIVRLPRDTDRQRMTDTAKYRPKKRANLSVQNHSTAHAFAGQIETVQDDEIDRPAPEQTAAKMERLEYQVPAVLK